MTQAAVSYQIKVLEERVGSPLFIRKPRQVELTDTGRALAQACRRLSESSPKATSKRARAARERCRSARSRPSPRTGSRCISARSRSRIPSIAVRLDTSDRMVNLAQDNIDIGIRTGYKGDVAGPGVASPVPRRLHADAQPLARRHDRRREGTGRPAQAAYHGRRRPLVDDVVRSRGHRRKDNLAARTRSQLGSQAFEGRAAVAGIGVAILSKALFAQELANGSLIQPFDIVGNDSHAYWLVYQEARRNVPKIRAFRDWMLAEIGASTGGGTGVV